MLTFREADLFPELSTNRSETWRGVRLWCGLSRNAVVNWRTPLVTYYEFIVSEKQCEFSETMSVLGCICVVFWHRLRKITCILWDDDWGHGEVGLLCVMIVGQISRHAPLTRDNREGYRGYLRDFSSGTMSKSCDCVCEFELSVCLEMIRWQDGGEF